MPRNYKNKEKRLIVSQDNRLIQKMSTDYDYERNLTRQSFVLDIYQRKLICLLLAHVRPDAKKLPVETVSFNGFMKFMNIHDGGRQYKKIHASISKLMGMSFCLEVEPGVFEYYHWIASGCRVDTKEKIIYIQLDPGLKKFIVGKKRNFTQYELGFVSDLKKKYSCRLYDYLRSMVNLGCVNLNVDTFSEKITDNKYPRAADQKRYVIEPALEEINATTDITVSVEEVREEGNAGRLKTVGYKFHVKEKTYDEKQVIMGTWGIPFEELLLLAAGERPNFDDVAKEQEEEYRGPFGYDDD